MLLDQLRRQTRAHHERLEQLNGLPANRTEYLVLLESFYGVIAPWEERLAQRLSTDHFLRAERAKTAWLVDDLEALGVSTAGLSICRELPPTPTELHLLGGCYVLEGSALGGQVIARHAGNRLGIAPDAGARFFHSYGAEVPARWQAFRQELLRHSSAANDRVIIGAAQEMFACLAVWFAARRPVLA